MKTRRKSVVISLVLGLGIAACTGKLDTGLENLSDAGQGGSAGGLGTGGIGTSGLIGGTGGSPTGGIGTGGIVDSSTGGSFTGGIIESGGMGGNSMGGTSGCIDVCALYGPACCIGSGACIQPGGSCVVDVLSAFFTPPYEYPDLEKKIASVPQDVLVSFTDTDIAWAAADPAPTARIEMHMSSQASSLYGTALDNVRDGHPFRVSCGGQSLFVGVTYIIDGQAAINTPVLAVARDANNLVVLRLGAWEGSWYTASLAGPSGARERIDRPELRTVFCQRGALWELNGGRVPYNHRPSDAQCMQTAPAGSCSCTVGCSSPQFTCTSDSACGGTERPDLWLPRIPLYLRRGQHVRARQLSRRRRLRDRRVLLAIAGHAVRHDRLGLLPRHRLLLPHAERPVHQRQRLRGRPGPGLRVLRVGWRVGMSRVRVPIVSRAVVLGWRSGCASSTRSKIWRSGLTG